jgi:dihydrofolate synthase / folylpolyglutamate synthase
VIVHPVLGGLARYGVRLGLERLTDLLHALGDPHLAYPVVHVGGTNGKGSVTRMVGACLREAGFKVGEYTSPHLQQVNERIRIDGRDIGEQELDLLLWELDRARAAWVRRNLPPPDPDQEDLTEDIAPDRVLTYFEMMTAAAFLSFQRHQVDVAVLEVGMGGRLDATNVVPQPLCTAIVSVGLDHTAELGPDQASIAGEKAGILKAGVPVVVGNLQPAALRVVRAAAYERGAPLHVAGQSWRIQQNRDQSVSWTWKDDAAGAQLRELELGLLGDHQVENAGVALSILHLLPEPLRAPEAAIRAGMRGVRHPGRLEWLVPEKLLLDCAHNPDGATRLAQFLAALPRTRRRTLLFGASSDKDVRTMMVSLARGVDRVLTTHCDHPRAAGAGALAQQLVGLDLPVLPAGPVEVALPMAREGDDLVIVAGSIFLVGAVRDLVLGR